MVLTRRACSAEGPVMTEMIEPVARGGQQQELAQRLVEQAHAEGVELIGPGRLLPGLTKTVLETALQAEITGHLGYDKHDPAGRDRGNSRNGTRPKTVLTEVGPVEIDVPRERDGSFTPAIVRKRRRRLDGIDQIVLSGRPRRADREASASAHDGRPPAGARRPAARPSHRAERRDQHEGLGHPKLLQQTRWSSHGRARLCASCRRRTAGEWHTQSLSPWSERWRRAASGIGLLCEESWEVA
ncbi:MAG: putative transposase [Pseudonocardia sp.]|jgi:hypothetical protein